MLRKVPQVLSVGSGGSHPCLSQWFVLVMNLTSRKLLSAFCLVLSFAAAASVASADEKAAAETSASDTHVAAEGADSHAAEPHAAQAHEGGDHSADSHGGGHETGVPGFKADLALWSLVVFVLFLLVLRKAAWTPLIQGLDKREAGIRKAISDAEENQRKSQALLAEYQQKLKAAEQTVQEMVAEAKRDAERTGQDLVATAQKEVTAIRNRARDDIQQAKDAALSEVFASVNRQVISATEQVLGRALSSSDQDRFVQEALSGISR